MTNDELIEALERFAKDPGYWVGQVSIAALGRIRSLEYELHVIPPGGVSALCILKGCTQQRMMRAYDGSSEYGPDPSRPQRKPIKATVKVSFGTIQKYWTKLKDVFKAKK